MVGWVASWLAVSTPLSIALAFSFAEHSGHPTPSYYSPLTRLENTPLPSTDNDCAWPMVPLKERPAQTPSPVLLLARESNPRSLRIMDAIGPRHPHMGGLPACQARYHHLPPANQAPPITSCQPNSSLPTLPTTSPPKHTILWGLPPWQFKHGRGLWSYSTYHGARYHSQIPSARMGLLVSKTTLVRPQQTVLSTCNACPTMAPGYHDRQLESTRQCLSLPYSSHQCSPHSSGSIHGHQAHLSTICDCTQIQQKCCRTMEPCPRSPVGKSTSCTASFDLIPV